MGDAVMKRFEIEKIIASIDGIREGTESFPDLSDAFTGGFGFYFAV